MQSTAESLGCPIYLTGALARDLWLTFGFGIDTGRRTEDVDFAVQCTDWKTFSRLADALKDRGLEQVEHTQHKFRHSNGQEIDLIPYGGVERPDRTIAWPPNGNPIMNLLGFAEVATDTTPVLLPGDVQVPVISQRALALVKLLAWEDRGHRSRHKHATDLLVLGRTYLETRVPPITPEREAELLERNHFTDTRAGAHLLGMDMASLCSGQLREAVSRILDREADAQGPLTLARAFRLCETEDARAFVSALRVGYSNKEGLT